MINSPVLQLIPDPRYRIVSGTHSFSAGAILNVIECTPQNMVLLETKSSFFANELREFAKIISAMADALEKP